MRQLTTPRNAELRSIARTVFLGYVVSLGMGFLALIPQELGAYGIELLVLVLLACIPYALAARTGFRATGVGYDRRVTMLQFVIGAVPVLGLLWGVFNTWELIFRIPTAGGDEP